MIAYYFPPLGGGGVQRTLKYTKYLPEFGWEPTVLTTSNTYFWKSDSTLWRDVPEGIEIFRSPLAVPITMAERVRSLLKGSRGGSPPPMRSKHTHAVMKKMAGFVFIPDIYSSWLPLAVVRGLGILKKKKFDAIYSSSPPETAHLVGYALHKATGIPWIADFRDPWVEGINFWTPTAYHRKLHYYLENLIIEKAHRIICTSGRMAVRMKERYAHLPGEKFVEITNGFDEDDYRTEPDPGRKTFVISHTGMLSLRRSNYHFMLGLHDLLKRRPEIRPNIDIRFIGVRESSNDKNISRLHLDDVVSTLGLLPHKETLEHQNESHLLLLIEADSMYSDQIIPGKLFDYIGARRQVLGLLPDGAARDLILKTGCGRVVGARDVAGISQVLEEYHTLFTEGKLQAPHPAAGRSGFSRRHLANRFSGQLNSII